MQDPSAYHILDVLDKAAQRGTVSHDQNSLSGRNFRRDRLQPERNRSLDQILERLVLGKLGLGDGSEQVAVS